MKYIKIKFTLGLDIEAYQVIDDSDEKMVVIDYVDLDGNSIELPLVTESHVVNGEILNSI